MLDSMAIALSTCGSPAQRANANAKRPATRPASIPRSSTVRIICSAQVAREAEQMASVVHKLMDHAAMKKGSGSLLRTDEIDEQQQQAGKQSPREQFAQRNHRE